MVRRRKQKANAKRQNVLAVIILIAVAISVSVAGYFYFKAEEKLLDKVTLCPIKGAAGHYVLLVDKTDPLTFMQKEAFMVGLEQLIKNGVPESYLLSVYVLGENFKDTAKPLLEVCNPGSGDGKSSLTANLKQLRKQYEDKFVGPLMNQATALVGSQPAKQSPILEMIQLAGINSFKKQNVVGPRKLYIMSDMLHNTPEFGMYKGNLNFSNFDATAYGRRSHAELDNVDVDIKLLLNSPALQTRQLIAFWESYFEKSGARIVSIEPM